uniref:Uncharacterized protein n=1 Tax=Anopheles farauti TaxID=69004 RepID=A0A182QTB5_9DIPT
MMRLMVQGIRKNIKPLILVVSFITFIWLIMDTVHRPEFVRHASQNTFGFGNLSSKHSQQWHKRQVKQFIDMLNINSDPTSLVGLKETNQSICPLERFTVFTAFVGSTLLQSLWHYFSLVAIHNSLTTQKQQHQIVFMLPATTRKELSQLFARIPFEEIDKEFIRCYYNPKTCVINDETHIEISDNHNQLFILNNQTKRLQEIMELSWEHLKEFFSFRMDALKTLLYMKK